MGETEVQRGRSLAQGHTADEGQSQGRSQVSQSWFCSVPKYQAGISLPLSLLALHYPPPGTGLRIFIILRNKPHGVTFSVRVCDMVERGRIIRDLRFGPWEGTRSLNSKVSAGENEDPAQLTGITLEAQGCRLGTRRSLPWFSLQLLQIGRF